MQGILPVSHSIRAIPYHLQNHHLDNSNRKSHFSSAIELKSPSTIKKENKLYQKEMAPGQIPLRELIIAHDLGLHVQSILEIILRAHSKLTQLESWKQASESEPHSKKTPTPILAKLPLQKTDYQRNKRKKRNSIRQSNQLAGSLARGQKPAAVSETNPRATSPETPDSGDARQNLSPRARSDLRFRRKLRATAAAAASPPRHSRTLSTALPL